MDLNKENREQYAHRHHVLLEALDQQYDQLNQYREIHEFLGSVYLYLIQKYHSGSFSHDLVFQRISGCLQNQQSVRLVDLSLILGVGGEQMNAHSRYHSFPSTRVQSAYNFQNQYLVFLEIREMVRMLDLFDLCLLG